MTGREWTEQEEATLRRLYRKETAAAIGLLVHRSRFQVYNKARWIGLAIPNRITAPDFQAYLLKRHAEGWSDSEIAAARRVDRHAVTGMRRRLGLRDNSRNERWRQKIISGTLRQCRAAGVASLGALRAKVLRERSAKAGWPADLPWRAGQILTLLWERGPMTRVQLVEAIRPDLAGRCTRKRMNHALGDNDVAHGRGSANSYLANLLRRGLIVDLGRLVRTGRKGGNLHLYSLPLSLQRGPVVTDGEKGEKGEKGENGEKSEKGLKGQKGGRP